MSLYYGPGDPRNRGGQSPPMLSAWSGGIGGLRGGFQQPQQMGQFNPQMQQQMQRLQQMQQSGLSTSNPLPPPAGMELSPDWVPGTRMRKWQPISQPSLRPQQTGFIPSQTTGFPAPRPYGGGPGFAKPLSPNPGTPQQGGAGGAGGAPTSWKMSIEPMAGGGMIPGYQHGGMHSDTLSTARRTLPNGYVIPTDSVFSSERPFHGSQMGPARAAARLDATSDLTRRLLGFEPNEPVALQRGNVSLLRGSLGNEFGRYNEEGEWVPWERYERDGKGYLRSPAGVEGPDIYREHWSSDAHRRRGGREPSGLAIAHRLPDEMESVSPERYKTEAIVLDYLKGDRSRDRPPEELEDLQDIRGFLREDYGPVADSVFTEISEGRGRAMPASYQNDFLYGRRIPRAYGGIIGLANGGYIPMYARGMVPGYGLGGFFKGLGKVISKVAPIAMNFIPGLSNLSGVAKAGIGALTQGAGDLSSDRGLNLQRMLGGAGRAYATSSAIDRMRDIPGLEGEGLWGSLGKILTDKDIGKEAMGAFASIPFGEAAALGVTEAAGRRGAEQQAQGAPGFTGMVNPMGTSGRIMPGSGGADPAGGYADQLTYGQTPIDYTNADGGLIPGYKKGGSPRIGSGSRLRPFMPRKDWDEFEEEFESNEGSTQPAVMLPRPPRPTRFLPPPPAVAPSIVPPPPPPPAVMQPAVMPPPPMPPPTTAALPAIPLAPPPAPLPPRLKAPDPDEERQQRAHAKAEGERREGFRKEQEELKALVKKEEAARKKADAARKAVTAPIAKQIQEQIPQTAAAMPPPPPRRKSAPSIEEQAEQWAEDQRAHGKAQIAAEEGERPMFALPAVAPLPTTAAASLHLEKSLEDVVPETIRSLPERLPPVVSSPAYSPTPDYSPVDVWGNPIIDEDDVKGYDDDQAEELAFIRKEQRTNPAAGQAALRDADARRQAARAAQEAQPNIPERILPTTGGQAPAGTPLATSSGTGRGSGFSGEQRWFDPNAPAPVERDIGGFSPHDLPRTSADFAAAGDAGGAGLLDRLNAPAAPVQNYLSPAPVPGAAEGGLISQVPMEELERLAVAAQQIESPGSQQIIEQAIEEYGLDVVNQIITMIQQQGPMTAPDGAMPGSGMNRGGLINGGGGDAMADDILVNAEMAMNGERQPIAVSAGEYIVPGDVLGHLGSGNTEEGGEVMDQFIEDVRMQRTGSPEQPPPIDLRDVLPGTYGERYA